MNKLLETLQNTHNCAPTHGACSGCKALAELERRTRIEARRDRSDLTTRHYTANNGEHVVEIGWQAMVSGRGPDYHTALEKALDAAGAP